MSSPDRLASDFSGDFMNRVRRRVTLPVGAIMLSLLSQTPALAQGGSEIVYQQRTPWLEASVVIALCGAALFAVCRSSRRN